MQMNRTDSISSRIITEYNNVLVLADPRVQDFLLMENPIYIVLICTTYVYFVLYLGPRLMADKKPYDLKPILIVYNALQTIFSAVMFYQVCLHWFTEYGLFQCMRVDFSLRTPAALREVRLCHIYFLSKISELLDTVFFVLRKKDSHVSLLHVFHHAAMPLSVWVGVKFHPGGNLAFFGIPNLFVHIWMYLYYMMAAMGPQYQKYIWWKRHITEMQLAQFAIVMVYMLIACFLCTQNWHLVSWIFLLDFIFVVLFVDFYRKAYHQKKVNHNAKDAQVGVTETDQSNDNLNVKKKL